MKLWVKLDTSNGFEERMFDIPDDAFVESLTLSSMHGPLIVLPFQLEGDFYVRTVPPGLIWQEMPE